MLRNPAKPREYRDCNHFTETFTVAELAELVVRQGRKLGIAAKLEHLENPRVELEQHHYNPAHTKLLELGLEPHYLSDVLLESMLERVGRFQARIKRDIIRPRVRWDARTEEIEELKRMWAGA